jgi:hypothetical protein
MEELTPQERFNRLLSFLKDPQGNPHPTLALDGSIFLGGRSCTTIMVNDCLQEAIEVMESGLFHQGCLKGNQKTDDFPIDQLEHFVLQLAAVVRIAKLHDAKSLDFFSYTFDGKRQLFNELQEACADMLRAFDKAARIMLEHRLIRPDRLGYSNRKREVSDKIDQLFKAGRSADEIDQYLKNHKPPSGIWDDLCLLKADSLNEAHKKREMSFDLITELIPIFLQNIPQMSNRLIATRIFDHIIVRLNFIRSDEHINRLSYIDKLRQKVKCCRIIQ